MANKRKITTAIVAGVTAVALMLGGTFAWTSISQQAKNETAGIVNVGGRLHDDFNGTNKDVYVENFTDPLNGGQPIYARVRLDEYMEVGKDAGGIDVDGDQTIDAVPVITGTNREVLTTWKPHVPADACEECDLGNTCVIHEHWTWTMGGQGDNGGKTTFMPTFNKDKDSLKADINGTYHGTNDQDKVYYDDYVVYTTDNTTGGVGVAEADKETYDGNIYSVIGTEYYDDDTDTEDNDGTRQVENVTHTAKETAEGSVITMDEWINTYNKAPGNYWVYDTDGWAYWANPIMPGEATGLLLDGIEMEKNPGEKCYYAINVVGQFATVGDWEYFTDNAPTAEAMELLKAASDAVPTVTIGGSSMVAPGETVALTATVTTGTTAALAETGFKWSLVGSDGNPFTGATIDADGNLTVNADVALGTQFIVMAESNEYPGAVGMKSMKVVTETQVITPPEGTTVNPGSTTDLSGTIIDDKNEIPADGTIEWGVTDLEGNEVEGVEIDKEGNLTVGESVTVGTGLKVTATVKDSEGNTVYEEEISFVVGYPMDMPETMITFATAQPGDIVENVDNNDWIVLAKSGTQVLIWADDVIEKQIQRNLWLSGYHSYITPYVDSQSRAYLNGEYYANEVPTLKPYIAEAKLSNCDDRSDTWDRVFLLSQGDLTGQYEDTSYNVPPVYTFDASVVEIASKHITASQSYWLRTYYNTGGGLGYNIYIGNTDGTVGHDDGDAGNETHYLRPAMWLDLSASGRQGTAYQYDIMVGDVNLTQSPDVTMTQPDINQAYYTAGTVTLSGYNGTVKWQSDHGNLGIDGETNTLYFNSNYTSTEITTVLTAYNEAGDRILSKATITLHMPEWVFDVLKVADENVGDTPIDVTISGSPYPMDYTLYSYSGPSWSIETALGVNYREVYGYDSVTWVCIAEGEYDTTTGYDPTMLCIGNFRMEYGTSYVSQVNSGTTVKNVKFQAQDANGNVLAEFTCNITFAEE